jgi:AraC family transcriptional regulator
MPDRPNPDSRTSEDTWLIGIMATYNTQAEASEGIPKQWRAFLRTHPALQRSSKLCGASPCTGDHKIQYLTGVVQDRPEIVPGGERLKLEAGEYAVVRVNDESSLRDTWIWLLNEWLPTSGRQERNAPEFERYTGISETGTPLGPVEIWIPLEPPSSL